MHPDEGRRPIISQSAPIASGPEHFQAKWNTWRLGKCDHTNSSQVEHLVTRKMRPHKDLFWRQPHGAHQWAPFRHTGFHRRAHTGGVLVPHLGTSESTGSRALSAIASAQIWQKEFGTLSSNRSMHPALISVPDTAPPRQGSSRVLGVVHAPLCGETRAKYGRAVAECLSSPCCAIRASQLPNPWSKPTDDQ